jgi:hypothetical protein
MALKVKEIKPDALISINVNKNFYMMTKALSYYLYHHILTDKSEEYMKNIMTKKYEDLDDAQRSFYTVALLLAEIEHQAKTGNHIEEKEVLQPGDEGYVEPTQG